MFCRLPGKLAVMDKEPYFTYSTRFQELSCFFSFTFQAILHYKIPSAITNELVPLHLILTPMTNQHKIQAISGTKNRICNFYKIISCGIPHPPPPNFKYLMKGAQGSTLHTVYHVAFSLFQFVFIYALKGIDFLPPYFHRAAFTKNNKIPFLLALLIKLEPSVIKWLLDKDF